MEGRTDHAALAGDIRGPRLSGKLTPGGGDWLLVGSDRWRRIDVRAHLEMDDGAAIFVSYHGIMELNEKMQQAIFAGTAVDWDELYSPASPSSTTSTGCRRRHDPAHPLDDAAPPRRLGLRRRAGAPDPDGPVADGPPRAQRQLLLPPPHGGRAGHGRPGARRRRIELEQPQLHGPADPDRPLTSAAGLAGPVGQVRGQDRPRAQHEPGAA